VRRGVRRPLPSPISSTWPRVSLCNVGGCILLLFLSIQWKADLVSPCLYDTGPGSAKYSSRSRCASCLCWRVTWGSTECCLAPRSGCSPEVLVMCQALHWASSITREPWERSRETHGTPSCRSRSLGCWRQQGWVLQDETRISPQIPLAACTPVYPSHTVASSAVCEMKRSNACLERWTRKCKRTAQLLISTACSLPNVQSVEDFLLQAYIYSEVNLISLHDLTGAVYVSRACLWAHSKWLYQMARRLPAALTAKVSIRPARAAHFNPCSFHMVRKHTSVSTYVNE